MAVEINKVLIEVEVTSKGVVKNLDQVNKKLNDVGLQASKAKKEMENLGGAAGIAGATAAEFGRLISDLPYGLQAVTNNMSQLGSMFALLVSSSGGVIKAFKNLGSVLMGPAGILIAFQAAIAALEFFSRGARDASKATAELNVELEAQKRLLDSIALTTNENLNKTIRVLTEYSTEFKTLFEDLLNSQGANSEAINTLLTGYSELLRIRRQIEAKEKAIGLLQEGQENTRIKLLGQINQLRLDEVDLLNKLGQFEPVERVDIDSFYDFGADAAEEFVTGFEEEIKKQAGRLTGFTKITELFEPEPYFPFIDLLKLEGELAIEQERENAQKLYDEKQKSIAKTAELVDTVVRGLESFNNILNAQAERELTIEQNKTTKLNDQLRIRLANEQLSADQRDLINQQISRNEAELVEVQNQIARKQFKRDKAFKIVMALGDTASSALKAYASQLLPFDPTSIGRATVAAKIAAAFGLAQVAALSRLKYQEQALPSPNLSSVGGGGGAGGGEPTFNVVGAAGNNQLAAAIASTQNQPVKAFVVASDVTTAQQLDRNIISSASI